MRVLFFIVKGKNEICSIHVRFADSNRFDKKTTTGLTVNFKDWSEKKSQVKIIASNEQKDFTNTKLREIKDYLIEQYNFDYNMQKHIGNTWLKDKIKEFFGRADKNELYKIYFIDWIQKFIDESPTRLYQGQPVKKRTIQHYVTTKYKLDNYEKHFNTKLRFQDVGLEFYRNFLFYCQNIEKINNNTIGGYITNIKKWCKIIDIEGLPINPQYRHSEFSTISNKTKDIYLTEKEIDAVFKHDFSNSERLDNVRDNFIIGLRTGLRISDFMQLKKINIIDGNIEIETAKTSHPVVIPLHQQIKEILLKRDENLPNQISDAKFNEYVKEVCKEVGFTQMVEGAKMINKKDDKDFFPNIAIISKNKNRKEIGIYPKYELITSHTCRRSFASNLYGKLPNMTIMSITGHKTEAQFLKYIKITSAENAMKLKEHWDKEKLK
ncbi:MAG: tyrosine-type recombinase/integrase [Flavobacterium circumlabens]|uniref:Integrase n=1 Tax=Flavobacterium circumlabens TaxID=2133765 RepID=A0A4Y7UHW7_9FLAO|nr:tyrosine-type recombinase/integrase [Flavobacterium circumlabens]TCN60833.1 phage integrase family protein [Flavobacterium circumlabens]TEB45966.1 integrase [Flavobacterium circumlabens]